MRWWRRRGVAWASEDGQMLPLLALLMVMSTFAGVLVVDLGTLYEMRARVHAVADLAALAAAQELPDKNAAIGAAREWARFNGLDDDAADVDVTVEIHGVPCTQPDYCVRVAIQRDFEWTFGGLFSLTDTTVPSTVVAEKRTNQRDIVFIFDKSGSLQPLLPDLRRAAIAFSNSTILRPGPGGDLMGLVSFAGVACPDLALSPWFGAYASSGAAGDNFQARVVGMTQGAGGGGTNIKPALDAAIAEITTGGRAGSDRLIILFSDGDFGDASRMSDLDDQLSDAQGARIVIHALGVATGRAIDRDGLMFGLSAATGGTYVENPDWPGSAGGGGGGGGAGACPGTGSGAVFTCTTPGSARCLWNDALDEQFDAIARSLSVIALAE